MSGIPSGMKPGKGRATPQHHPCFLGFLAARAQEPQALEVNGAVGGVAFLNPRSPQDPSQYSQIHWRWENQVTIASWKRGQEPMYPKSRFLGRLELLDNHTLKMSDLSVGDSSEYRLYLEDDTGKESVQRVRLRVYGVTYEWIPLQNLPRNDGPVLSVSFNPAVETYVCRVSNPVSSNNASLTYRPPCSWTGESSSVTCATPSALVTLGHLVLLFLLLPVA
ncbi:PREDICTED: CD48 antigen isoform X3 [Ficedula albicollis]|uniref:CD48 antigen isoform X3 n=1 Tax=Ficedula albicollis TaxID=59894 RepID=UPI0003599413|nr:PREDICTED: CD48 antigen isoform X3 [Ficedula albicollis]